MHFNRSTVNRVTSSFPHQSGAFHPTARSVLEDARLIHEFLRETGTVTNLKAVEDTHLTHVAASVKILPDTEAS